MNVSAVTDMDFTGLRSDVKHWSPGYQVFTVWDSDDVKIFFLKQDMSIADTRAWY